MLSLADVQRRARANNNLSVVVGTAFMHGAISSVLGVVWQPFVLSLGASMSVLGLLASLGGFNGIIPTLVSPIGGWLADRRGRKLLLVAASLSAAVAYALYTLSGLAGLSLLLVPGIIFLGLTAMAQPATSALIGESVRASRRGSAYSVVTFASVVPGILAPLVAGWLADRIGYTAVFPLLLGVELITVILLARYLRETRSVSHERIDWPGLWSLLRRAWFPPKGLGWFFVAMSLDLFSWGMGWGLLYGLLTRTYHFSASDLGILSSVVNVSWALTQLPIGRLVDRFGSRIIFIVSQALGPPLLLIWMTQTRFEIFALSMPLFALGAATWVPAKASYVTHSVEPARRAETFGRMAAFTGIVAFPSTFIGGFLYDHLGFAAPILANLIGSVVTLMVLILFVKEPVLARAPARV